MSNDLYPDEEQSTIMEKMMFIDYIETNKANHIYNNMNKDLTEDEKWSIENMNKIVKMVEKLKVE